MAGVSGIAASRSAGDGSAPWPGGLGRGRPRSCTSPWDYHGRREVLQSLMEGVVDGELTVVLSSHLITDMERVCDFLIVLSASRTQVAGEMDELLGSHRVLIGPRREVTHIAGVATIVRETHTD